MIRSYRGMQPRIASSAFIDESAQVIGDVEIGERSSIWMCSVVRGDVNYIRIGEDSNVQDNSVLHVMREPSHPLVIGDRVTIGHNVVLHGCTVESDCLIGIGAIVLNGAHVWAGSIVAAGAVVIEGMVVPPRSLVLGSPAKVRRAVSDEEFARIREYAAHYTGYAAEYREES